MSLLSAIHASRTGLLANTRRAEIVSSNIANAQDENYSRRSLSVTEGIGGGVQVLGVSRAMNTAMDALFRSEMSYAAKADVMSHSLSLYTIELGDIDSEISLPAQLANFENTLGLLSNAPENANLQQQTLNAAEMLTQTLRDANSALGQINTRAVDGIATDVKTANATLEEIARINTDIAHTDRGTDAYASLEDRLSAQLDKLSEVIEIDVTYDTEGRAKVHTAEGQTLVFASYVNELSFDRAAMALYAGTEDITPGVVGRRNSDQGSIAGHFEMMGTVVPQMQIELDEIARSLIEGFEDADASLAPGQAGLFTDRGFAYDPANQSGLAGRIAVNAAVDPQQGGELYRLRDGIGATAPGAISDNSQLLEFVTVFSDLQSFAPEAGQGTNTRISDFVAGVFAKQQSRRVEAEASFENYTASTETFRSARLDAKGVNIDTELQQLTLIEQAYNANSQVLRVASQMIDTLLDAV
ncbi:MAG: flagellar hook-associated protein FlgK [Pseudooceanicola atlanticus]